MSQFENVTVVINVNSYFDGKVASIAFQGDGLPATVGVMDVGEYTFDTASKETMTVVSGALTVQLPGSENWDTYQAGDSFVVAANASRQPGLPSLGSF